MKNNYLLFRKSLVLLVFVSSFFLHADAQPLCTAYFQSVYNSATDEVDFSPLCTYDTSIHPLVYMWDFGDGSTAVEEFPSHHYATGNNYLVCLYLFVGNGAGCCQDTFCEQIDFLPASIPRNRGWISDISVATHDKNVSLHVSLEQAQTLRMNLVTIAGRVYPVRVAGIVPRGKSEINFTMADYPAGIYLIRIEDESGSGISKRFMVY